jgi:hypothetical protein
MKEGSLSQNSARNECLIRPTSLWNHLLQNHILQTQIGRRQPANWGASILCWLRRDRKMFHKPADLVLEEAPAWIRESLTAAKTDDPSIDLSGRLTNFSPRIDNPFVRYFSDDALAAAANGLDSIQFFDDPQTLKRVLPRVPSRAFVVVEQPTQKTSPRNVPSTQRLETQLGSKFEMYFAALAVQSRCRELHIWNSSIGLRVLAKYKLALRSAIPHIYYHGDTAACPEDLRTIFDACLAIS